MRLENFLRQFSSKNTILAYRQALSNFYKTIYPELSLEEASEKYFQEIKERDPAKDLDNFFVEIKNRPPKTVRLYLSAVRTFLLENDVELPEKYWRKLRGRKKGTRAVTIDKVPNNVELRKILTHIPIQGKALYLTLASSGMRIGEVLKLKLNDVDLKKDPIEVKVRAEYTKTGNKRIAFVSSEAREAITEWLKVRNRYLQAASKKSHKYEKAIEDTRLFPFEITTAYSMWWNALSKAGYSIRDDSTNRHQSHVHTLRKFFRSKAATLIPVDIVEALMGHEGYLTEVYRRYSEEDLAEFYKKAEGALLVFSNGAEVSKLRAEVEERNKQLQTLVNGLTVKNIELEAKIAEFEKYRKVLDLISDPELSEWLKQKTKK